MELSRRLNSKASSAINFNNNYQCQNEFEITFLTKTELSHH